MFKYVLHFPTSIGGTFPFFTTPLCRQLALLQCSKKKTMHCGMLRRQQRHLIREFLIFGHFPKKGSIGSAANDARMQNTTMHSNSTPICICPFGNLCVHPCVSVMHQKLDRPKRNSGRFSPKFLEVDQCLLSPGFPFTILKQCLDETIKVLNITLFWCESLKEC